MNDNPRANGSRGRDPYAALRLIALIAAIVGVIVLAAAAFVLSYGGIHKIALSAGVSPNVARIFPVIFDAMLVVSCAAVVSLRSAGWWQRTYSWLSHAGPAGRGGRRRRGPRDRDAHPPQTSRRDRGRPPVGPPAAGVQPAPVDAPAVPPRPGGRGRRGGGRRRRGGTVQWARPASAAAGSCPAVTPNGGPADGTPVRAGHPGPADPAPPPAVAGPATQPSAVHPARTVVARPGPGSALPNPPRLASPRLPRPGRLPARAC